ncbi:GntR family transcriptional regulator [Frankia sp. CNm7]|uniref:GntR family transcriptional regulator n=1 Tax=Frankia nepalensis TaxID=1836974 RepID=A0A937US51_9ACTN|nr:GntR family transcriptional regulator [Frankia nepalensis]MBL7500027.1 GntR family transcriptional regulator [Frankia nepalensis]MBL7511544.1 GntR family transcriptional regulator [Frankia nepalensis]MBL7521008.1 GntR family transcriptional regulator [Frankia nepalensis]MBL7628516.1 GntR family transcriptional regulator [Frankia nepalensis]
MPPNRRTATAASPLSHHAAGKRSVVDRRSSGSQVADHIRSLIFAGTLRQGDHVRQDEIAEELGVSRIPVREAMIALESEGWISIEPHRGAFVHGLDLNSVRDHYALLGQLYGLAAERATERGEKEGVEALSVAERALRAAQDPDDVLHANETYLRQIFAMAASPRLSSFGRLMTGVIPGNFFELVPGTIEPQKRGIAAVNRAIREGDGQRASAEFVKMLRGHGELVVDLLRSRNIIWAAEE